MATAITSSTARPVAPYVPSTWKFTRDEFGAVCETGIFGDKKVELIDGEIVVTPSQNEPHVRGVRRTDRVLQRVFAEGWSVRNQAPLVLGDFLELVPDVAVIRGRDEEIRQTPTGAVLVVEVADTTLSYDRNRKASIYAKGGVVDYWIVNIPDRVLEVRRNAQADPAADFGFSYRDVITLRPGDSVTPLGKPEATVAVNDLLP